ncbi:MAG: hypothetical protein JNK57_04115 [Planctomycetaceae bacterium]|nr:hypothetical protein [Planctomycetaceae bacterium]
MPSDSPRSAPSVPRRLRVRDVVVLAVIVFLGIGSFMYQWVQSFYQERQETDSESIARMRDDFAKANQVPPFRTVNFQNLSLPAVFFRSGPQDTIRISNLGHVCSIVDIDIENGYFVCLPTRQALSEFEWTNIRFCHHLTLMGNPNVDEIERKLLSLPAFAPLSDLAKPLGEPQSDGPYQFTDLQLVPVGEGWTLNGNVTSTAESTPKQSIFRFEIFQGESMGFGRVSVESLVTGQPQAFTSSLPNNFAGQIQSTDSLRVKIVLEVAADRNYRN